MDPKIYYLHSWLLCSCDSRENKATSVTNQGYWSLVLALLSLTDTHRLVQMDWDTGDYLQTCVSATTSGHSVQLRSVSYFNMCE